MLLGPFLWSCATGCAFLFFFFSFCWLVCSFSGRHTRDQMDPEAESLKLPIGSGSGELHESKASADQKHGFFFIKQFGVVPSCKVQFVDKIVRHSAWTTTHLLLFAGTIVFGILDSIYNYNPGTREIVVVFFLVTMTIKLVVETLCELGWPFYRPNISFTHLFHFSLWAVAVGAYIAQLMNDDMTIKKDRLTLSMIQVYQSVTLFLTYEEPRKIILGFFHTAKALGWIILTMFTTNWVMAYICYANWSKVTYGGYEIFSNIPSAVLFLFQMTQFDDFGGALRELEGQKSGATHLLSQPSLCCRLPLPLQEEKKQAHEQHATFALLVRQRTKRKNFFILFSVEKFAVSQVWAFW